MREEKGSGYRKVGCRIEKIRVQVREELGSG